MPWRPRKAGQLGPLQAQERLAAGNQRFVAHAGNEQSRLWDPRHASGQVPIAAVLGCADSRAPAELLFDQGLGDLFVVRVAGNIVAPSIVGSLEFAIAQLGTPLIVVLGHTRCGAVGAAIAEIEQGAHPLPTESVLRITGRIRPIIEPIVAAPRAAEESGETLARACLRANVQASVAQL